MLSRHMLLCLLFFALPLTMTHQHTAESATGDPQLAKARTVLGAYAQNKMEARLFDTFGVALLVQTYSRRPSPSQTSGEGRCNDCDVKARLDNFAFQLQSDPSASAYIVSLKRRRGGRLSKAEDEAIRTAPERMKVYLINERAVDAERIVTVVGLEGKHNEAQLWVVTSGSTPPFP